MACRNCCSACSGNVPGTWTVTIDGNEYTLTRSKTTCNGTAAGVSCVWRATIDDELWECETATCVELRITQTADINGLNSDFALAVRDEDHTALAQWFLRADYPADCLDEQTLPLEITSIAPCEDVADAEVTITPGPISKCCPCSACCDECAGSDYTAAKWTVTLDGRTFTLLRRVRRDVAEDGSVSEVCVWSAHVGGDLYGEFCKELILSLWHETGGASTVYKIQLEATEADDSEHTLWLDEALAAFDCGEAQSLDYVSGFGSADDPVTVTPSDMRLCPPPFEGSQPAQGDCPCCQLADDSEEYDVDLGAGGLVDENCDYCDQVIGVFTLARYILPCTWIYTAADVCVCDNNASFTPDFGIFLRKIVSGANCYWEVSVSLDGCGSSSSEGGDSGARATYRSSPEAPDVACDLSSPKTLTRVSQHVGVEDPNCSGTFPATITLQSV